MRVCGMVPGLAAMLLAMILSTNTAHAQVAVYAQATGASLQALETAHTYGGTFGVYDTKHYGPITAGPDVRVAFTQQGGNRGALSDQILDYGAFGARFAASPGVISFLPSLMPYAEALVGIAYWRGGYSTTRQDGKHSLLQVMGGLDYKIVPRITWRVAEASYARVGATPGHINPITVSTGFVVELP